jgi:hypothetical protein
LISIGLIRTAGFIFTEIYKMTRTIELHLAQFSIRSLL